MSADDVTPETVTTELLVDCSFPPAGTAIVCAYSGGADSTALLALASAAGCDVSAIHVDHGLRPTSGDEAQRAVATAARIGVDCHVIEAHLDNGPNLEARARAVRRDLLGTDVVTGHTADDQAETALLALLRGSGATGLSAIAPGPTKPILRLGRADTHRLCDTLGLDVVTDPSNTDPRFRRNRVRNEVLPLLNDVAARDVAPLIARAADLLRDDDALLDELAAAIDPTDARAIAAAPLPLARRAIRRWLTADGYPPDARAVDRVLDVASGRRVACQVTGHIRVERSNQRLQLFLDGRPTG